MDILKDFLDKNRNLVFALFRLYFGIALFVKGIEFLNNDGKIQSFMEQGQLVFATVALAHYVTMGHLVCGFMLAVGLLTRLAAFIQLPILLGAVIFIHMDLGLQAPQLQFDILVLALLGLFSVYGGGVYSVDYYVENNKST